MEKRSLSCTPSSYWRHRAINCFFIFPSSFTHTRSRCDVPVLFHSALCFSRPVVFPQRGLYVLYVNTRCTSAHLVNVKSCGVWLRRGDLPRALLLGFVHFLLNENNSQRCNHCSLFEIWIRRCHKNWNLSSWIIKKISISRPVVIMLPLEFWGKQQKGFYPGSSCCEEQGKQGQDLSFKKIIFSIGWQFKVALGFLPATHMHGFYVTYTLPSYPWHTGLYIPAQSPNSPFSFFFPYDLLIRYMQTDIIFSTAGKK